MIHIKTAEEALGRLRQGNEEYLSHHMNTGDISPEKRFETAEKGQVPFACVLSCSDSRVIPENIFCVGIGEIFVIRVAGNVVGDYELGSIEYAEHHLGCPLILVLGHTDCGAIGAVLGGEEEEGHICGIMDEIRRAIGEESDPYQAAVLNVKNSMQKIHDGMEKDNADGKGAAVVGAIYDIASGKVEFL